MQHLFLGSKPNVLQRQTMTYFTLYKQADVKLFEPGQPPKGVHGCLGLLNYYEYFVRLEETDPQSTNDGYIPKVVLMTCNMHTVDINRDLL